MSNHELYKTKGIQHFTIFKICYSYEEQLYEEFEPWYLHMILLPTTYISCLYVHANPLVFILTMVKKLTSRQLSYKTQIATIISHL